MSATDSITVGRGPGRLYVKVKGGELKFVTNVDAEEWVFVQADLNQEIDPEHP